MEELETLTKKQLQAYAEEHNLPALDSRLKKADMIEEIKQSMSEESSTEVAIKLHNSIYYPRTGRLEPGIHLVNREVAEELQQTLTDNVVEVVSAKEVAAFYGLGHGNITE